MKSLTYEYSHHAISSPPGTSSLLGPNILLSNLFCNTFYLLHVPLLM